MPEVINVRFRSKGKAYYFDPAGAEIHAGDAVIVETAKGVEFGECVRSAHYVEENAIIPPLRPVIRVASADDKKIAEANRAKEKAAFELCLAKIEEHKLDMKLVDVEYSFDGSKILFFFTSDDRVDFRELVKDLAGVFRTRIELRQIGVRDSAKLVGGLGICGRPFCCSTFLEEFQPVSIKMAKTQSLSLNPAKISGTCGRLMCCLKYEQDAYEHLLKTVPKVDAAVDTPDGKGTVAEVNLLRRRVKVKLADESINEMRTYDACELGFTVGGEYKAPEPEEKPVLPAEKSAGGWEDFDYPASEGAASASSEEKNDKDKGRFNQRNRGRKQRDAKKEQNRDKNESGEKPEKAERPAKQGKFEKTEKSEKQGKFEKTEKSEKQGKFEKTEKPAKQGKFEKNEKPEKQGKFEKSEKTEKPERAETAEKPEQTEKSEGARHRNNHQRRKPAPEQRENRAEGENREEKNTESGHQQHKKFNRYHKGPRPAKPEGENAPKPGDDKARARADAVALAVSQANPKQNNRRSHHGHRQGGNEGKTE